MRSTLDRDCPCEWHEARRERRARLFDAIMTVGLIALGVVVVVLAMMTK